MPSLNFEAEQISFRNYYTDNYELLKDAEEFVRSLITSLLSQASDLEKPTVISRLKDRDESIQKFSRKYQTDLEHKQTPYEIVAGRGRNHNNQTYGCPLNFNRGDSVCSNRVRVRRDVPERQLLAGLQEKVLREEVTHYVMDRFETELLRELEGICGDMERMRKRKADLDIQIRNLTDGLAMGIHSPAGMSEIAKREREVAEISDRLLSSQPQSVNSRIVRLREKAMERMRDLRVCLNEDSATARPSREAYRKHCYGTERESVRSVGKLEPAGGPTLGVCRGAELNCLRRPFQGRALPVSYLGTGFKDCKEKSSSSKGKTTGRIGFLLREIPARRILVGAYFMDSSNSRIHSFFLRTSRGLEPSGGPTMPSFSIRSMRRAARP
jgi:hypothetical protein